MKKCILSRVSCLVIFFALALMTAPVFAEGESAAPAAPAAPADKTLAVFVQNRTRTPGMDTACGAVRERIVSAFAEVPGFRIVDSTIATDSFNESPNVIKSLGCDYVAVAGIVGAGSVRRNIGGSPATVFTLRMTFKVLDANGTSVDGMPMWKRSLPIQDAGDDPMNYYEMLFDDWATDLTKTVATKAPSWRAPAAVSAAVSFVVSTTIDSVKEKLESQTKGINGEQLQELRKVVGGASVELDGLLVGTAPCALRATPGLHKLRVKRQWMKDYEATVNVTEGQRLEIALELNDEGVAKWGSLENVRAAVAKDYAEAAMKRGLKVNVDTQNWRDVGTGPALKVEK